MASEFGERDPEEDEGKLTPEQRAAYERLAELVDDETDDSKQSARQWLNEKDQNRDE